MPAIVLTNEEISALQALVSAQGEGFSSTKVALSHPFVDLTSFAWDIEELVNRARDSSSHVSEDFEDFLNALEQVNAQREHYATARRATLG